MGFRNDEAVVIDARVEHTTAKARLIELETDGRQIWLPKSQTLYMGEADMDGNREFHITEWIAKQNGLA